MENPIFDLLKKGISHRNQRLVKEIGTLMLSWDQYPLKRKITQIIFDEGVDTALRFLQMSYSGPEGWGRFLESLLNIFGVPELNGIDVSLTEYIDEIIQRNPNTWNEVPQIAREASVSFIKKQISHDDTFLLQPSQMKDTCLLPLVASILESRKRKNKELHLMDLSNKIVDLSSYFGTANGFDVLVNAGIGPSVGKEDAQRAISLLKDAQIINEETERIPQEETKSHGQSIQDYSHLFDGFSLQRINLFNGIMQALHYDEKTTEVGIKSISSIGHSICKKPLFHALESKNVNIRETAIQGLRFFSIEEVEEILIELIESKDTGLMGMAANALGMHNNAKAIPVLASMCESNDEDVAVVGILGLSRMQLEEGVEKLVEILSNMEVTKRDPYILLIGNTKSIQVIPLLVDSLFCDVRTLIDGGDVRTANALIQAKGEMKKAVETLFLSIRESAMKGLAALGDLAVDPLIAILETFLGLEPTRPRGAYAHRDVIMSIGTMEEKIAEWARMRAEENLRIRSSGILPPPILESIEVLGTTFSIKAIPFLTKLAHHKEQAIRMKVMEALCEIDTPALEALLSIPLPSDDVERLYLTTQIGTMMDKLAEDWLIERLDDNIPKVRMAALGFLAARRKQELLPYLEKGVRDNDSEVRASFARTLAEMDDSMFKPLLKELAKDQDKRVREAMLAGRMKRKESSDDKFWA